MQKRDPGGKANAAVSRTNPLERRDSRGEKPKEKARSGDPVPDKGEGSRFHGTSVIPRWGRDRLGRDKCGGGCAKKKKEKQYKGGRGETSPLDKILTDQDSERRVPGTEIQSFVMDKNLSP